MHRREVPTAAVFQVDGGLSSGLPRASAGQPSTPEPSPDAERRSVAVAVATAAAVLAAPAVSAGGVGEVEPDQVPGRRRKTASGRTRARPAGWPLEQPAAVTNSAQATSLLPPVSRGGSFRGTGPSAARLSTDSPTRPRPPADRATIRAWATISTCAARYAASGAWPTCPSANWPLTPPSAPGRRPCTEAGTRDLPVASLARAAAVAGLRLALLDGEGREVGAMGRTPSATTAAADSPPTSTPSPARSAGGATNTASTVPGRPSRSTGPGEGGSGRGRPRQARGPPRAPPRATRSRNAPRHGAGRTGSAPGRGTRTGLPGRGVARAGRPVPMRLPGGVRRPRRPLGAAGPRAGMRL